MISGSKEGATEKSGKWPCGVCAKGVGVNSIKCTKCHSWTHKKCSGVKGSLASLKTPFVCKACTAGKVDNEVCTGIKVGDDTFERVGKFCYLEIRSTPMEEQNLYETCVRSIMLYTSEKHGNAKLSRKRDLKEQK